MPLDVPGCTRDTLITSVSIYVLLRSSIRVLFIASAIYFALYAALTYFESMWVTN